MKLDYDIAEGIEIAVQRNQHKEIKFLGSYALKIDGSTIFKYNRKTREISPASYRESETFVIGGINSKKLDIEKGCVYVEALNEKNALKRLKRGDVIFSS